MERKSDIRTRLETFISYKRTLASTIEEYVARRVQTKGTSICHLSTARKVRECGDILIENINTEYLYKFYAFLAEKGLKTNTCSIQLRNIRTVVNYAQNKVIDYIFGDYCIG